MTKAFTLAEVLITLAIIGVVAALTMPSLITQHQKKVTETKLKKFASVWAQTYKSIVGIGDQEMFDCTINAAFKPDDMFEFFNRNFAPYMKFTEVVKMNRGIRVAFPDGSGLYMVKTYATPADQSHNCTFCATALFCVDYKYCKNYDETKIRSGYGPPTDGRNIFPFYVTGDVPKATQDRETLLEKCRQQRSVTAEDKSCLQLIQKDGWEIRDDYPW